jgi:hypothetical protein
VVSFCLTKLYQSQSLIIVSRETETIGEESFIVCFKVHYLCNVVILALDVKQRVGMERNCEGLLSASHRLVPV